MNKGKFTKDDFIAQKAEKKESRELEKTLPTFEELHDKMLET